LCVASIFIVSFREDILCLKTTYTGCKVFIDK
jgi:hypothetical protein